MSSHKMSICKVATECTEYRIVLYLSDNSLELELCEQTFES